MSDKFKPFRFKASNTNPIVEDTQTNESRMQKLEAFLESEKQTSAEVESWSKMNRVVHSRKLQAFAAQYRATHELTAEEEEIMNAFFTDCLDKKRLEKVKDVVYDKTTGEIRDIPGLVYNRSTKRFTLRNTEKMVGGGGGGTQRARPAASAPAAAAATGKRGSGVGGFTR